MKEPENFAREWAFNIAFWFVGCVCSAGFAMLIIKFVPRIPAL
jgi:hypothetical protein